MDELKGKNSKDIKTIEQLGQESATLNTNLKEKSAELIQAKDSIVDLEAKFRSEQETKRVILAEQEDLKNQMDQALKQREQQSLSEKELKELKETSLKEAEQSTAKLEKEHKERLHELQQELDTVNYRLEETATERNALEKSLTELREGKEGLEQQRDNALSDVEQQLAQLRGELGETKDKYQASISDLEQLKDTLKKADAKLTESQQAAQKSDTELKGLQDIHSQTEAQLQELEDARKLAEEKLHQERGLRQQAEADLKKQPAPTRSDDQGSIQSLRAEIESLNESLKEADFAYDEIREKAEILIEEKEKSAEEIQELQRRENTARQLIEELTIELEELRTTQDQFREGSAEDDEGNEEADALREELRLVQMHSNTEIKELREELLKAREKLEEKLVASGYEKAEGESLRQEMEELQRSSKNWEQRLSQADAKCITLEDAIEDRDEKIDQILLDLDEAKENHAEAERAYKQNEERIIQLRERAKQDSAGNEYVDSRLATQAGTLHMDDVVLGRSSGMKMTLWALLGAVICFVLLDGIMMLSGRGELITGILQDDNNKQAEPGNIFKKEIATEPQPRSIPQVVTATPRVVTPSPSTVTEPQKIEEKPEPVWSVLTDINFGPTMIRLRGGRYFMGSNRNQVSGNEWPAHEVALRTFAISKTEVTFDEYDRFAQATGRRLPEDNGWGRGQRPVVNVSWDDAQSYTVWLSERTGKKYRLPTEAEWEFAIRGGDDSTYWWGYQVEAGRENCFDCGSEWDRKSTAPVASFLPNNFGLHDMAGNVREWVEDCYHPNYDGAPQDGSAWMEPGCEARVARGGAYNKTSDSMRSTWRGHFKPDSLLSVTGFRVVREL